MMQFVEAPVMLMYELKCYAFIYEVFILKASITAQLLVLLAYLTEFRFIWAWLFIFNTFYESSCC